ncbi:hypothetical protein Emed_004892 [Eimeria media]
MFPSAESEALAAACAHKLSGATSPSPNSSSANQTHATQGPRQRRPASPGSKTSRATEGGEPHLTRSRSAAAATSSAAPAVYTPEQAALCETVLRETCYYKTLGVTKDASEETIRKAYKRWALVLHPDKNKAPKAEDAFKKLNKVCSTLLDSYERRKYDLGGEEALDGRGPPHMQRSGGPPHPDIMTAEVGPLSFFSEILAEALMPGEDDHKVISKSELHNFHALVQFLPMLLLFLMMLLFNMVPQDGNQQPVYYSFRQSREFPVPRTTQLHSVRYFVGDGFMQEILPQPEKVRELERNVERAAGGVTSEGPGP